VSPDSGVSSWETGRIDALHELLSTLAAAVDVRQSFQRLGEIVGRIVPHDEARLVLLDDDTGEYQQYASPSVSEAPTRGDDASLDDSTERRLFLAERDRQRGFRASLRVPILMETRPSGMLVLLSRRAGAYAEDELTLAARLVDYIALALSRERQAERARAAALERERAADFENWVELLRTMAEVLDIRRVFPRVSEIVGRVLPHDHLTLIFHDREGNAALEARSSDAFPEIARLARTSRPGQEVVIVRDFSHERQPSLSLLIFMTESSRPAYARRLVSTRSLASRGCGWYSGRSVLTRFLRTTSLVSVGWPTTWHWPLRTNNWPKPSVA
jgi:GAF domain-containing protein